MKMSNDVNELFAALSKFQGELENAPKDKPGHGYKYADLAMCINTAKEPLANNGLSVTQMLGMNDNGKQTLITMLSHSSGQYISSEFVMVEASLMGGAGKNPAQVLGSAITYQRRYSYAAIIGLAQEDDDAKNVSGKASKQDDQLTWYNNFDADKENMIAHLASGGTHKEIFDNLDNQNFKISKEVREKINSLNT